MNSLHTNTGLPRVVVSDWIYLTIILLSLLAIVLVALYSHYYNSSSLFRYLSDPFLINGSKFDLRVYVYVTSLDPLIIYIYRDGLVRFATVKWVHCHSSIYTFIYLSIYRYSQSNKSLSNRFVHLTNYSVNKRNSKFESNSDEKQCVGHKW